MHLLTECLEFKMCSDSRLIGVNCAHWQRDERVLVYRIGFQPRGHQSPVTRQNLTSLQHLLIPFSIRLSAARKYFGPHPRPCPLGRAPAAPANGITRSPVPVESISRSRARRRHSSPQVTRHNAALSQRGARSVALCGRRRSLGKDTQHRDLVARRGDLLAGLSLRQLHPAAVRRCGILQWKNLVSSS